MLNTMLTFGRMEADAIKAGAQALQISKMPVKSKISKIKWTPEDQTESLIKEIQNDMNNEFAAVAKEVVA
jgi:V/A-type H+-transporting ATPase subunit A